MYLKRTFFTITLAVVAAGAAFAQEVQLKIVALNDLHGVLESQGKMRASAKSPEVPVGGVDYLAGYVKHLIGKTQNHIYIAGGDLTGASPLTSGLFHDEPTIEALNLMGLDLSAVGNHEFDKGEQEFLRMQRGRLFSSGPKYLSG